MLQIGAVGAENKNKMDNFELTVDPLEESNYIIGSHTSLIFQEGVDVMLKAGDKVIATTTTNIMGAYEFMLESNVIPEGTEEMKVVAKGEIIRTLDVVEGGSSGAISHSFALAALVSAAVLMLTF